MKSIETSILKRVLALALAVLMVLALSPAQGLVVYAEGEGDGERPVAEVGEADNPGDSGEPGDPPDPPEPGDPGNPPDPGDSGDPLDPLDPGDHGEPSDPPDPDAVVIGIEFVEDLTYTGEELSYIKSEVYTGKQDGDRVLYMLDRGKDAGQWLENLPEVKEAGAYTLAVHVMRGDEEVADWTGSFTVAAAEENTLKLTNEDYQGKLNADGFLVFNLADMGGAGFPLTAESEFDDAPITYELRPDDAEVANITPDGHLNTTAGGYVEATISQAKTDNHPAATLVVPVYVFVAEGDKAQLLSFENGSIPYALSHTGQPNAQKAVKKYANDNDPTYILEGDEDLVALLTFDSSTGAVTIDSSNVIEVAKLLVNGGRTVRISAVKEAMLIGGTTIYPAITEDDGIKYSITFSAVPTVDSTWIVSEIKGTEGVDRNGNKTGWYTSDVKLVRQTGAYMAINGSFSDGELTISGDGVHNSEMIFAYRNSHASNPGSGLVEFFIAPEIKIDAEKPTLENFKVSRDTGETAVSVITFGKNSGPVTFTVDVSDTVSGVDCVVWSLVGSGGSEIGSGNAELISEGTQATFTLPSGIVNGEDVTGNLTITVYDKAGNKTSLSPEQKIVIDNTAPVVKDVKINGKDPVELYSKETAGSELKVTFILEEANFNPEQPDGFVAAYTFKETTTKPAVSWTEKEDGVYQGSFTIPAEDGAYTLSLEYTDPADNPIDPKPYEIGFTVDLIPPAIAFSYDTSIVDKVLNGITFGFYQPDVTVTVTVTDAGTGPDKLEWWYEKDEKASDSSSATTERVAVTLSEPDAEGKATASFVIPGKAFGLIKAEAWDKAGNSSKECTAENGFVVDNVAPGVTVTYETTEDGIIREKDDKIYYSEKIIVKITVDEANFQYNNFEEQLATATLTVDGTEVSGLQWTQDGDKYTATHEIKEDGEHTVTFTCRDASSNNGEGTDFMEGVYQSGVMVLDTTAPEVSVKVKESSPEDTGYYGNPVTLLLTVKEPNFLASTVEATFTADNPPAEAEIGEITVKGSEEKKLAAGDVAGFLNDPKNWKQDGDTFTIEIVCDQNADYEASVKVTDPVERTGENACSKFVVDLLPPTVSVSYTTDPEAFSEHILDRTFYNMPVTATVTITEHNFDPNGVTITVEELDPKPETATYTISGWTDEGDVHTCTITFSGDANYLLKDIVCEDLAGNKDETDEEEKLTVDQTPPEPDTDGMFASDKTSFNSDHSLFLEFFQEPVTAIFKATDVSGVKTIKWKFEKETGVSNSANDIETYEGSFSYNAEGEITVDGNVYSAEQIFNPQCRGVLYVTYSDFCNNKVEKVYKFHIEKEKDADGKEIDVEYTHGMVVDNKAPEVQINLPQPIASKNGRDYYDGDVDATITIKEANFFKEDPVVTLDGVKVNVNWTKTGDDTYTAIVRVSGDGDHRVEASYTDRSGNSGGAVAYPSIIVVDTEEPVITVTGVEHHSANNDDTIGLTITVTDRNLFREDIEVKLEAIIRNENGEYEKITIDLGEPVETQNGEYTVYTFTVDNLEKDGYYMLTANVKDMSGHTVNAFNVERADEPTPEEKDKPITEVNFTVNREGSVFWVETEHNTKDHPEIIKNELNDKYVNGDKIVVKIHEINVDEVDTANDKEHKTVLVVNNGEESTEVELTAANYVKNEPNNKGSKGWYECVYTMSSEKEFSEDGNYSVNLLTVDAAGNKNLNTDSEDGMIHFVKDTRPPDIVPSVESGDIKNDSEFTVQITISDANLDTDSPRFYLDGEEIEATVIDENTHVYTFVVKAGLNHTFSIDASDLAGNEAETMKVDKFTVSTNFLVRWYANTPLFIGSVGGVTAVTGGLIAFFVGKKKKKEEAYTK